MRQRLTNGLPGGGIEAGENEKDCVIREVAEETGYAVRPSECLLEIDEYYAGSDETRRGLYFREYTALTELDILPE